MLELVRFQGKVTINGRPEMKIVIPDGTVLENKVKLLEFNR